MEKLCSLTGSELLTFPTLSSALRGDACLFESNCHYTAHSNACTAEH